MLKQDMLLSLFINYSDCLHWPGTVLQRAIYERSNSIVGNIWGNTKWHMMETLYITEKSFLTNWCHSYIPVLRLHTVTRNITSSSARGTDWEWYRFAKDIAKFRNNYNHRTLLQKGDDPEIHARSILMKECFKNSTRTLPQRSRLNTE